MEVISPSNAVRDITLTLTYQGKSDSVKATGIWSSMTDFRNTGAMTTAIKVGSSGHQLKVQSTAGFNAVDYVHVFDNGDWETYEVLSTNEGTGVILLDSVLRTAIDGGEIVRQGYWAYIDKQDMINSFLARASHFNGKKVDGAMLGINSHFYNSMVMKFTLTPFLIGEVIVKHPESGIVVDISRQKEHILWKYTAQWPNGKKTEESSFPAADIPNDDGPNLGPTGIPQQDEDTDPFQVLPTVWDDVYVRDMPGDRTENASANRFVYRMNFREFVRIKLDGKKFTNVNEKDAADKAQEGSRASHKVEWNSRMDLIDDGNGKWTRKPNAPAKGNQIELGHEALLPKP